MEACEKCQKIRELQELEVEVGSLIDILECALKYDELENLQSIKNIYLVEIIKEKFKKMSAIIQEM